LPWDLRADFDRHHLTDAIGPVLIFNRLHDAIEAFEQLPKPSEAKAREVVSGGMGQNLGEQGNAPR